MPQDTQVLPFSIQRNTTPGELTHIDLWGKYDISSINGSYYYLLMIDDATRYTSLAFLKTKDQAGDKLKQYLTHLTTHNKIPCALHLDKGLEFLNANLRDWCLSKGIDMQTTAPYSPLQNGVAEHMNCTLVKLAQAMLIAAQLPEFLWEHAITHVAYIRNHAYSHAIGDSTPYQRWYDRKPTISHLQEFSAPVWVLLQGQKVQCKMLPKSLRRTYIGYEDGSKSIKYYSAETRKVLTSRNFHFLSNLEPQESTTDDDLVLTPNVSREGENGQEDERNLNKTEEIRDCKRKRKLEDEPSEPRKTRGIRRDYQKLHDPYESEEEKS